MTGKGEPLTNEEVRILEPKDVDNSDISIFGEHFYTNCGYFFNVFCILPLFCAKKKKIQMSFDSLKFVINKPCRLRS